MTAPSVFLRTKLVLLFCIAVLCLPTNTRAFPISLGKKSKDKLAIDITMTSTFEYHTYNPADLRPAHSFTYFDLQNRVNVDVVFNQFRLGGRLDTFTFFDDKVPCPESFPDCKGRYIPEKLYLKVRMGRFDFVAGDYYLTVGRGIALSARKVDEFGIDTSIRGGRISYQNKGFKATVAGGFTNVNNMDPVKETFIEDPNQLIFAAEASQQIGSLMTLSGHYVYYNLQEEPDEFSRVLLANTHVIGGSLHFPSLANRLSLYFEGNAVVRTFGPIQDYGYAFYASSNLYLFPFTVRVEGQWYTNLTLPAGITSRYPTITAVPVPYNNPPSMERQELDTQGDNTNSKGLRLRVDYTFPSRTTILFLNYMFRFGFAPPDIPPEGQLFIHNVYAGGEHRTGPVTLKYYAGIREMTGFKNWRLIHADMDLSIKITGPHSIEFVSRYWWNRQTESAGTNIPDKYFHIFDAQLGYAWAKWLTISILFSYSDEFKPPIYRQIFIAGEVKVHLWEFGSIKFFGGLARGGLRCVSGVCRIFPPFEGIRTELSLRF